jgi:hypothetical protein
MDTDVFFNLDKFFAVESICWRETGSSSSDLSRSREQVRTEWQVKERGA